MSNSDTMQVKNTISINRLERLDTGEVTSNYIGGDVKAHINHLQAQMEELKTVTRLQNAGRFRGRYKVYDQKEKFHKCTYSQMTSRKCLAEETTCNTCGETRHFTKCPLCKKTKTTGKRRKTD